MHPAQTGRASVWRLAKAWLGGRVALELDLAGWSEPDMDLNPLAKPESTARPGEDRAELGI